MGSPRPRTTTDRPRLLLLLTIALGLGGLLGCGRPFVDPVSPEIEVVRPDLTEVLFEPRIELAVRASSFRSVTRVTVDGAEMAFDEEAGQWTATVSLGPGTNVLRVEAFDEGGVAGVETLYALYLPLRFETEGAPIGPTLGGHTATLLPDGHILIAGGATAPRSTAESRIYLLRTDSASVLIPARAMRDARSGHTATLLPGGRVLFLGGSVRDVAVSNPAPIDWLVETPEIWDPTTGRSSPVPIAAGRPIRRTGHTTMLLQLPDGRGGRDTLLYLFGGAGDIRYGFDPRWGIRDDFRVLEFRNDSLIAVGPALGIPFEAISGHTQTPLDVDPQTGLGRYLFAGTYFPPGSSAIDETETVALQLTFSLETSIRERPAPPFAVARTRHAAVALRPGVVGFFGGRRFTLDAALDAVEIYADAPNRMFRLPDSLAMRFERWGHTATKLPDGRILLLGGFGPGGNPVRSSEWVQVAVPTAVDVPREATPR